MMAGLIIMMIFPNINYNFKGFCTYFSPQNYTRKVKMNFNKFLQVGERLKFFHRYSSSYRFLLLIACQLDVFPAFKAS